jgi:cell division transport system ATP-binding protein
MSNKALTTPPLIELNNVQIFQDEHLIIDKVNIRVEKGDFLYIIGKTGSGKSSLLKSMYAELPLRSGTGNVAGFNLKKLNNHRKALLRRKIGIITQDFRLLMDRNVFENLDFVLKATEWRDPKKRLERIEEVLEIVQLSTKLYNPIHKLSGGEQQRVAIARALLNYPEIIFADEPTGHLDPNTAAEIYHYLYDLVKKMGTSIVVATHNYYLIEQFPSKVLTCHNGEIV